MGCLVLTIWAVGLLGCSAFGSGPVAYLPYFLLLISAGEAPGLCTEQGPERHLHTPTSGIVFSLLLSISRLLLWKQPQLLILLHNPEQKCLLLGWDAFIGFFFCLVCVIATSQPSSPSVSALCSLQSQDAGVRLEHTQEVMGRSKHPNQSTSSVPLSTPPKGVRESVPSC